MTLPDNDDIGKRIEDLVQRLDNLEYQRRRFATSRTGFHEELLQYLKEQLDLLIVLEHRLSESIS